MIEARSPIRLVLFGGGYALPVWVAEREGYFARHGVAVEVTYTPNSVFMMKHLIEGDLDIAVSAMDNLVAYQEGQGEAEVHAPVDLVAFMGVDQGFHHLMAAPDVKSVADLRGRELAVDALTTGYAFILREMLSRAGLSDDDVIYVRAGGGPTRLKDLIAGKYAAGLLATPQDLVAEAQGLRRLGSARELLGRYQGRTAYAQRGWLEANRERAIGFMRAYRDAMAWVYAPENREAAVALLAGRDTAVSPALARRALEVMLDEKDGFFRDLAVDLEGVRTVLALRNKFLPPKRPLNDPMKYLDLDLHARAFNPA